MKAGKQGAPSVVPETGAVYHINIDNVLIEANWQAVKNLAPSRTIKKARDDNEFLVVLSNSLEIFFINAPGKKIFLMLDGQKTNTDILSQLLESDKEESTLTGTEIKQFIYRLGQYGLIL